jgi:hypothetical protein
MSPYFTAFLNVPLFHSILQCPLISVLASLNTLAAACDNNPAAAEKVKLSLPQLEEILVSSGSVGSRSVTGTGHFSRMLT